MVGTCIVTCGAATVSIFLLIRIIILNNIGHYNVRLKNKIMVKLCAKKCVYNLFFFYMNIVFFSLAWEYS